MTLSHRLAVAAMAIILSTTAVWADGQLTVKTPDHDFGTIREADGPVSYKFTVENTGDKPLVILSAKAQCGCTTPVVPKQPIKPGETATISVTYNPAGRPGEFKKTIRVKAKPGQATLTITGTVVPKNTPAR